MLTIEQLNRSWEEALTDVNAQTWARMKAVGATAGWEGADGGLPRVHGEVMDGPPNEVTEFVVRFRGNELVREAQRSGPVDTHVAGTLFRAARMLEALGVQVIPR